MIGIDGKMDKDIFKIEQFKKGVMFFFSLKMHTITHTHRRKKKLKNTKINCTRDVVFLEEKINCKCYEKWWRFTFQEDNNPKHTARADTDSVDQRIFMFSISKSKSRPKPNCEFEPGYKK